MTHNKSTDAYKTKWRDRLVPNLALIPMKHKPTGAYNISTPCTTLIDECTKTPIELKNKKVWNKQHISSYNKDSQYNVKGSLHHLHLKTRFSSVVSCFERLQGMDLTGTTNSTINSLNVPMQSSDLQLNLMTQHQRNISRTFKLSPIKNPSNIEVNDCSIQEISVKGDLKSNLVINNELEKQSLSPSKNKAELAVNQPQHLSIQQKKKQRRRRKKRKRATKLLLHTSHMTWKPAEAECHVQANSLKDFLGSSKELLTQLEILKSNIESTPTCTPSINSTKAYNMRHMISINPSTISTDDINTPFRFSLAKLENANRHVDTKENITTGTSINIHLSKNNEAHVNIKCDDHGEESDLIQIKDSSKKFKRKKNIQPELTINYKINERFDLDNKKFLHTLCIDPSMTPSQSGVSSIKLNTDKKQTIKPKFLKNKFCLGVENSQRKLQKHQPAWISNDLKERLASTGIFQLQSQSKNQIK